VFSNGCTEAGGISCPRESQEENSRMVFLPLSPRLTSLPLLNTLAWGPDDAMSVVEGQWVGELAGVVYSRCGCD